MTAVNVTVVSVIAGLNRNLCKQNDLFGHLLRWTQTYRCDITDIAGNGNHCEDHVEVFFFLKLPEFTDKKIICIFVRKFSVL
jgi:hypothetical protein